MRQSTHFASWLAAPGDAALAPAPTAAPSLPVLVVGAGPAGLAAMAALKEAGVAFEGVERHDGVGGIWDVTNPISSVYEGLRTVTTRATTHLTAPMPKDWPPFVPLALARQYLKDFADTAELTPQIRLRTSFLGATKTKAGTWLASFDSEHGRTQAEYRAIVVATGSHNLDHAVVDEKTRKDAEENGIRVIHSAQYREPSRYAGKRVLVIGAGASGTDIAAKVSPVAAQTILSIRTAPWVLPAGLLKYAPILVRLGIAPDRLAADSVRTPGRPRLAIAEFVVRLAAGNQFGLGRPGHRLHDRIPNLDRGILDAVRSGKVLVRPTVAGFSRGVVHFDGHPDEEIDEMIVATGYARSYPLLPKDSGEATLASVPRFYLFHPTDPGLAFMTECVGQGSAWPIFVEQGRAIAAYFAAEQRGGRNIASFNAKRGVPTPDFKGKIFAGADVFHVDYGLYARALRDLAAWLNE